MDYEISPTHSSHLTTVSLVNDRGVRNGWDLRGVHRPFFAPQQLEIRQKVGKTPKRLAQKMHQRFEGRGAIRSYQNLISPLSNDG